MEPAKIRAIRKKYENEMIEFYDDIDPTGYNSENFKEMMKNMNDRDFINMCKTIITKDDVNFSLDIDQLEKGPGEITLEKIKNVAEKHNIPLVEYVFMPFRNPEGEPMCTLTRVPILYTQVRRFFQQMLQHKNSISNSNSKTNPLTGQVVNEDKTASTTNIQTYALTITNRNAALKEYLGPRSDDPVAKKDMLSQIENTGSFRLADTVTQTHNKQAINTAEVFAKAAGVSMKFAGDDYGIDTEILD